MPKSIVFAIATVGWVMSLAFNLNPFMRFDGYYILSDLLEVENLQPRAFALARWHLRETLFNLKAPRPETFSPRLHMTLIAYAWATWIYRLLLFIGIALLVYALFFKVLGVTLFAIEIAIFVAIPIWSELKEWMAMRETILKRQRTILSAMALAALVALVAVPWSTRVEVPALLSSDDIKQVYPARAAQVKKILKRQGDSITKGEAFVEFLSPDLARQINLANVREKMIKMRLSRRAADKLDRAESLILERELLSTKTRLGGLKKEQDELIIRAPMSGTIIEFNPNIHAGRWLGRAQRIALIGSAEKWRLKGYIDEADVDRVILGANGTFMPDDPMIATRQVTLTSVLRAGTADIEVPDLASDHGGPIATRRDSKRRLVPVSAQFLATMQTNSNGQPLAHTVRGVVHLTGTPQSILSRIWRQVLSVLVRESGA